MTKRQILVTGFVASALVLAIVLAIGWVRAASAGHFVVAVAEAGTMFVLLSLAWVSIF